MTSPEDTGPDVVAGRQYDAALHLLDRQLVDPDGRLVAKVDDLELTQRPDGRLVLTAVLTGPGALGPRLGGRLGRWVHAIWCRLRTDAQPSPGRIPIADVVRIDSAVHLGRRRDQLHVDGFEAWVREYVVVRLPGADHDPE